MNVHEGSWLFHENEPRLLKFKIWMAQNDRTVKDNNLYWKISYMSQRIFTWKIPFWWKYAVDWILVIVGCGGGDEYKNLEFLKHEWSEHELIWHTDQVTFARLTFIIQNFAFSIKISQSYIFRNIKNWIEISCFYR